MCAINLLGNKLKKQEYVEEQKRKQQINDILLIPLLLWATKVRINN